MSGETNVGPVSISAVNLTKRYNEVTAVDRLNLSLAEGEIFGLLGPNGAGKTTTILMMLGLTEPTAGTVRVNGLDPARSPLEVKRTVGYLPDNVGFYAHMTGRENLRFTARLNALDGPAAKRQISAVLERVGLAESGDQPVQTYSRGMRQRLGIADVLVKSPRILFLDEPTLGIDPEGTREILDLIRSLSREEHLTVLLSSHLLYQVQSVCDRVGIFVRGRMVAVGSVRDLGEELRAGELSAIEIQAEPIEAARVRIQSLPEVERLEESAVGLVAYCRTDARQSISAALTQGPNAPVILHFRLRESGLEEVYRRYFQEGGGNR